MDKVYHPIHIHNSKEIIMLISTILTMLHIEQIIITMLIN